IDLSDHGCDLCSGHESRSVSWNVAVVLLRSGVRQWCGFPMPVRYRPRVVAWGENDAGFGSGPPPALSEWGQGMESAAASRRWDVFDSPPAVLPAFAGASAVACPVARRAVRTADGRWPP